MNLESAKKAHSEFRRVMREHGIKVSTLLCISMLLFNMLAE